MTFFEEAARNQTIKDAKAVIEACRQVIITIDNPESTAEEVVKRIEQVASDIKMYSLDKPQMNKMLTAVIAPATK